MLVAVDAAKGEIVWRKVLGDTRDLAPMGINIKTGTPNLGGPMVTAGGLVFIAASFDSQFRAFDVDTGKMLWSDTLSASGQATPMTYVWKGRQYVVIANGGYGNFDSQMGDGRLCVAGEQVSEKADRQHPPRQCARGLTPRARSRCRSTD
jgi:quinoprotein glucose dehydrogenase